MEEITVSKDELLELVEKVVAKRVEGTSKKGPSSIFKDVSITKEDIQFINSKFVIPEPRYGYLHNNVNIKEMLRVTRWFSEREPHVISKSHFEFAVHENLRLLTQRILGASRNTDIDKEDYEFAEVCYKELKEKMLELYERNLERNLEKRLNANGN